MQENRRKLCFLLSIKIEPIVEDFNIAGITIKNFKLACQADTIVRLKIKIKT